MSSLVAAALAPRSLQAAFGPLNSFILRFIFLPGAWLWLFLCGLVPVSLAFPRLSLPEIHRPSQSRSWHQSPVPVCGGHVLLFGWAHVPVLELHPLLLHPLLQGGRREVLALPSPAPLPALVQPGGFEMERSSNCSYDVSHQNLQESNSFQQCNSGTREPKIWAITHLCIS